MNTVLCMCGKTDKTFQKIVPCVEKYKVQLEHIPLITCIFLTEIGLGFHWSDFPEET